MRILIINTAEHTGGAAIAAERLTDALRAEGIETQMLVMHKSSHKPHVLTAGSRLHCRATFLLERLMIFVANRFSRQNLFRVSLANTGIDVTQLPAFRQADVIHLHWINQGFLSLKNIRRIIDSGKPVVWTMHDQWPFTGICHYSGDCTRYQTECHHCPLLRRGGTHDLAAKVFRRKQQMLRGARVTFVACSRWLEGLARRSTLLAEQPVTAIPNPLNTDTFHPMDQAEVRRQYNLPADRKLLLFGALKATDPRKGISYLAEACHILKTEYPELAARTAIMVIGNRADQIRTLFPFPVYAFDYVSDETQMVRLYNTADAYVTPSLEDNLPNTLAEAMACGLPCVGFRVGGIPEMIDHRLNGYVADYRSAADLARGMAYVLDDNARYRALSLEARQKALRAYARHVVVPQFRNLYQRIINTQDA